ncbi:hypothetical protein RUM44_005850 [Polyplax serrata]|uniref:C2H2-type domain-containing protein n=1 Tax=Polyplax serrata TaxID=468196 RepID=A0ABR1AY93_POLSC
MCDQTEVSYLEDNIVWVKIGPIWWPGVVKDLEKDEEGREILSRLKKKPIAAVKFFQEDNYEFVRNLDCIYHYSCRRKDEFIKKGLDKFRTGAPHMKKFPADVTTAESLTNGDVNIINDPKFLPEKKENYSEIFGSGKKKNKKDRDSSPRSRGRTSQSLPPYRPITHRRFINKALHGESDHRVKTLIQSNASSEDPSSINPYKCHVCKFETSRVNVIVAHHRLAHSSKNSINWTGSDSRIILKKPVYKSRKIKAKKLFDTSVDEFSDDDVLATKKKLQKGKGTREKTNSPEKNKLGEASISASGKRKVREDSTSDSKKPRFTDVLLADWSEEEEDDDMKDNMETKAVESSDPMTGVSADDSEVKSLDSVDNLDFPINTQKNQADKKSCFDFDEEEEGFIGMSNANTYGRKIPRVIPVKDKAEVSVDMEIDDVYKKRGDSETELGKSSTDKGLQSEKGSSGEQLKEEEGKPAGTRRRRSKASKDEEPKTDPENSLALRRTRRPGAKKSYLNEVIEKIVDESKNDTTEKDAEGRGVKGESVRSEGTSSSRRKQDFKNQTMESDREEMVYTDIVKSEQKPKSEGGTEKRRGRPPKIKDNITAQIDSLLEETKPSNLPSVSDPSHKKVEKSEEVKSNTTSFSFDYVPNDPTGKKGNKPKAEVKSISRMFSDSMPSGEITSNDDTQSVLSGEQERNESFEDPTLPTTDQGKFAQIGNLKLSQSGNVALKRGSIVLSSLPKPGDGALKVLRQGNVSKDCIIIPGGNNDGDTTSEAEREEKSDKVKNIKTIKMKPDSLPPSLISSGKLKGQTIIHQKRGKYVILTPPQLGRQGVAPGKVQSGSKVVILTNQHGEQKIITTSGLQQTKFKVEGHKIVTSSESTSDKEATASSSTSPAQPVIKMVPDGKGGIMKQLTVSPKKVLLGGTKVLVSASGSTFPGGNSVQKIALTTAAGASRTGGSDFRLIENYKGSGKTILIQGNPSPGGGGVVLKSSSVVPRQVSKVIQNPQALPTLKKKPKILMRASAGQGECVMQTGSGTIETPTYVVKQKGSDGKFSAQKIVRTELVNQGKASSCGAKRFILSGQGANKRGESFIITTNESVPSKVIRMRQKVKDIGTTLQRATQKVLAKTPEVYTIGQNSLLVPTQVSTETEPAQIVQVQDQSQQPVLQTQVIAMPGPVGADGNQTYVLVSVDENGVVQSMDNSVIAYDASNQQDPIFVNSTTAGNVVLLNQQANEEGTPVYSTSSQDILAEALANTNVLEGSMNNDMDNVVPSILLPASIPSSVVQETSITLQKPIMTPLEMPSSVAPDTSGLEPPPLPPTPTDEDVLMEESDTMGVDHGKKEKVVPRSEEEQSYMQSANFEAENTEATYQIGGFTKPVDSQLIEAPFDDVHVEQTEEDQKEIPREDYPMEVAQDDQNTSAFQSMPLLNDEPDTSDDAQGSELTGDQTFEAQKGRLEVGQQLVREQEPPSSTINEGNNHDRSRMGFQAYEGDARDNEKKDRVEDEQGVEDVPEVEIGKESSHSMPIITDEGNTTTFDVEPVYTEVMSQKRFQEETEVSSTTDEYVGKASSN